MTKYGVYGTLSAIINNLISPYDYTTFQSTIIGALFIISGLIGVIISGILLDKTRKYKLIFQMIGYLAIFFAATLMFTMPYKSAPLLIINTSLLGLSLVPVLAIGYSFSVELTYPVSEAMT